MKIEFKKKKSKWYSINSSSYNLFPLFQTGWLLFHQLFSRDLGKRKKKEKPTATIVDRVRQPQQW